MILFSIGLIAICEVIKKIFVIIAKCFIYPCIWAWKATIFMFKYSAIFCIWCVGASLKLCKYAKKKIDEKVAV